MASFPFKKRTTHFFYPRLFNPKFENVSLALHPQNFVCREHWQLDTELIIRAKVFSMTQCLSTIHPDGWETDDSGTIGAYSIAVIEKPHQKLCTL